ncbi:MAG: polymer-forming cytoskeletal protein [Lachnospiraceae bacterium]|nr:polymer-forming cytoskeletal protein [Lachnospiraceae bacterium]MCI7596145.1 polymer-forming cytoskeletal protein [Lachnospiraceae bacterium]MDY3223722.1 polymer-forming cytoskeletal protein [Lachnospiraceae bacterium]
MGFFQDLKEDLSQAVNEMIPDEEGTAGKPIIPSLQEDDDLAEIEAMFRKKEETGEGAVAGESVTMLDKETVAELVKESVKEPVREDRERKLDMNTIFNQSYKDEVSTITAGMTINGDITSQGSLDLVGCVHGNISVAGKMSITGMIEGNSQASEVYAESAKITGEIRSEGTVKVGQDTVIIGNIFAISAVIAGAVKGDIDVQGPVVLDSTAVVMGNIKSKSVQINNGAVVEGVCSQCYADVNPISFFDEIKKSG